MQRSAHGLALAVLLLLWALTGCQLLQPSAATPPAPRAVAPTPADAGRQPAAPAAATSDTRGVPQRVGGGPVAAAQPSPAPPAPAPAAAPARPVAAQQPATAPAQQPVDPDASIVRVVEQVRPAVASIQTRAIDFDQFLQPVPQQGTGSGVLFDQRGLVLTNNHVIAGAQQITVSLPDGRKFSGQVVGADPPTDLAVVKIDGRDLPVARLGNSDQLRVGETVIAIGNALNLPGGPTVTRGIVGALGRTLGSGQTVYYDLIQTDAAINPGNSGGPLVNLRGEVIGINMIIIQAPGAGIGFAIAVNLAKPVVEQLVTRGRVVRPLLGVVTQEVTSEAVRVCRLDAGRTPEGLVVVQVNSPAAQAGIRACDVIVGLDGQPTRTQADFLKRLWAHKPGDVVDVTVARGGREQTISVRLIERPPERSELLIS
ncbi:MAG: trypsin-like peptidase domain-containing protein [Chloroflexi bacterium]|nr:trypsin-like peptidase domain-containing protein [Chloroflexota bacterium]